MLKIISPHFYTITHYEESKEIIYRNESDHKIDLFDVISGTTVAENIDKEGKFTIPADQAYLIIVVPAGSDVEYNGL